MQNSIDLGLIGNGAIGALIDEQAEIVWCCMPRLDADPVFCSLLKEHTDQDGYGYCTVELVEQISIEQQYLPNTAVLVTRMTDAGGGVIEIIDLARGFRQFGRMFTPVMLIRQIRRLQEARVSDWWCVRPETTGGNVARLPTAAIISAIPPNLDLTTDY